MHDAIITQEQLKQLFHYNPDTGLFTRLQSKGGNFAGSIAGGTNTGGHRQIKINGRLITSHRLAYLYMTGKFPKDCIDHINRVPDDNRWCNLRDATKGENNQNRIKLSSINTSGYLGVHWCKRDKVFIARINLNNVRLLLGRFDNALDAYNCYLKAKKEHHSFFVA